MDNEQAADLVRQLADGLDPSTGEPLPADSPCQHPQIVRALFVARRALEGTSTGDRARSPRPEHAGNPWTGDDDRELAEAYDSGTAVKELADRHKRSKSAIRARLAKLGKVPATATRFRV